MRGSSIKIVRHIIKGESSAAELYLWGRSHSLDPMNVPSNWCLRCSRQKAQVPLHLTVLGHLRQAQSTHLLSPLPALQPKHTDKRHQGSGLSASQTHRLGKWLSPYSACLTEHEDLSSDPHHPCARPGTHRQAGSGGPWSSLASQSTESLSSGSLRKVLTLTCGLCMYAHTQACTHTQAGTPYTHT